MIIEYRKKTHFGKRRPRYFIFRKEGIDIPEFIIDKVIGRHGLQRKKGKKQKDLEFGLPMIWKAFSLLRSCQAHLKEILDKETLPKEVCSNLRAQDLPIFQRTVIDALTRIRFLAFSHKKDWFCGKAPPLRSSPGGYDPLVFAILSIFKPTGEQSLLLQPQGPSRGIWKVSSDHLE